MPNSKKMNFSFVLILFSVALSSCSNKTDCSDLRTGTFTTQTETNGIVTVIRTETQSIEKLPEINQEATNSLVWTGDCTFTISYESGDKGPHWTSDLPIDCKIIEIGEDFHIVRSTIRGTKYTYDYKMENKKN